MPSPSNAFSKRKLLVYPHSMRITTPNHTPSPGLFSTAATTASGPSASKSKSGSAGLGPYVTIDQIAEADEDSSGVTEATLTQLHRLEQDLALKDREIQAGWPLIG